MKLYETRRLKFSLQAAVLVMYVYIYGFFFFNIVLEKYKKFSTHGNEEGG